MKLTEINFPVANFYLNILGVASTLLLLYIKSKYDLKIFKIFEKNSYTEIEAKLLSLDEAQHALITADENGEILSANNTVEKLLGYSVKSLLHNKLDIIMPERYRSAHREGLKRIKAAPDSGSKIIDHTVELYALKKDGTEIPIELTVKRLNLNNKIVFVGIVRDITKEKSFREDVQDRICALEDKVKLLECSEEISKTGSWRWDLVKKEVRVSKGFKNIFGFEKDTGAVDEFLQRVYPPDQPIVNEALDKAFKGERYEIIYRVIRPDYSVATLQCIGEPVLDVNNIVTDIYGEIRIIKLQNYEDLIK